MLNPVVEDKPLQADAEVSDELMVTRAMRGDPRAFETLYGLYHRRIYALCYRMLMDKGLAEELTQEAFINAWRQLNTFRFDAKFSSWLHRIAVNAVISYQRKNKRWLDWLRHGSDEIPEILHSAEPGLKRDLEGAIAELPIRARQIFILVDIEGYTHEEAGELLGVASGTSKAQLFRARELLRGYLQ